MKYFTSFPNFSPACLHELWGTVSLFGRDVEETKTFRPNIFDILIANLSSFYCDIIHIDKSSLTRYDMQGAELRVIGWVFIIYA